MGMREVLPSPVGMSYVRRIRFSANSTYSAFCQGNGTCPVSSSKAGSKVITVGEKTRWNQSLLRRVTGQVTAFQALDTTPASASPACPCAPFVGADGALRRRGERHGIARR